MTEQPLYIRVNDSGDAIPHPITEDNLKMFFPDISANNIPEGFALFVRNPEPEVDVNAEYTTSSYGIDNNLSKKGKPVYTDIHEVTPIDQDTREKIINQFKAINPHFQDWVYDEKTNTLIPPIPKPEDGKNYIWTAGGGWIEKPIDSDEGDYKFSLMIENETYNLDKGQTQTVYDDGRIYYIKLIEGSINIDIAGDTLLSPGDIYYNDGSKPSVVTSLEDGTVIKTGVHNYQLDEFLTSLSEEERNAFIRNMNYKG